MGFHVTKLERLVRTVELITYENLIPSLTDIVDKSKFREQLCLLICWTSNGSILSLSQSRCEAFFLTQKVYIMIKEYLKIW